MRGKVRRIRGAFYFACLGWSCSPLTEVPPRLHVVVTTDLTIPDDIDALRVSTKVDGIQLWEQTERLGAAGLRLPADFVVERTSRVGSRPVQITVVGLSKGINVILRRSILPIPDHGGMIRMNLGYLCRGSASVKGTASDGEDASACGEGSTCSGGQCVSALVEDPYGLPPFDERTALGETSGCLDTAACFGGLAPVKLEHTGAWCGVRGNFPSSERLNVALLRETEGSGPCLVDRCLVPLDLGRGKDQVSVQSDRLTLPRAVCDSGRTEVVLTQRCPTKTESVPLCGEGTRVTRRAGPVDRDAPPPNVGSGPSNSMSENPSNVGTADSNPGSSTINGGPPSTTPPPPTCGEGLASAEPGPTAATVAGTLDGIEDEGLVLLLNRALELPIPKGATTFEFPIRRPEGSLYEVSIAASPPGRICRILKPSGRVPASGGKTTTRVECSPRPPLRQLAAAYDLACVLLEDGHVRCWGSDVVGQVNGSTHETSIPGLEGVEEIAIGSFHGCARMKDTTVRCWGNDADGKLAGSSIDTSIPGLSGVTRLRSNHRHTCALLRDGTVRCWGYDAHGQLGGSSPTQSVPGLSGAVDVAVGSYHTCVLMPDTTVRCWGMGTSGEVQGSSPTRPIPGLSGVVGIAAGWQMSCAWLTHGGLRCWGQNLDPSGKNPYITQDLPGVSGVEEVVVTMTAAWVRGPGGRIHCLGSDLVCPPPDFSSPKGAVEIAAGGEFACARTKDHRIECWGDNGGGNMVGSHRFRAIAGLSGVVDLQMSSVLGGALLQDGTLRLWGQGERRFQLPGTSSTTKGVPGLSGVKAFGLTRRFLCAVLHDGTVRCAGTHPYGERKLQFSDGPLPGLSGVVTVTAANNRACFTMADTTLRCWGEDGLPSHDPEEPPEAILGLSGVVQTSMGGDFPCVVLLGGDVRCIGDNNAEVAGWGSSATQSIPGLSGVIEVAAGGFHACALLSEGSVRCWGNNTQGQTAGASTNLSIPGLSGVLHIRAGTYHTCALLQNGSVRCWGARAADQTGGATPTASVPFIEGATGLAVAGATSCALLCNGRVQCWGDDSMGQGSGNSAYQSLVVPIVP